MIASRSLRRALLLVAMGAMTAALLDMASCSGDVRVSVATPTPAAAITPITPAVTLRDLLATTDREEVRRDVAPGGAGALDAGERADRSSARSLPWPRTDDSRVVAEAAALDAPAPEPSWADTPAAASSTPHELSTPAAGQLTRSEVEAIALDVSGSPVWALQAVAVSWCESRHQPGAIGALGEEGLYQVRPEYHGAVPADAYGQTEQAFSVWRVLGWRPWSCRP